MARKPMVTRTLSTTVATVLCLDVEQGEPMNETVTLTGTFKDEEKMLKACKAILETDTLKVVHVVHSLEKETLYGMSEQKFIQNAEVLPPRSATEKEEA